MSVRRAPSPDLPDLIARAQAGDREAWAELYRRYQPLLLRYIRYRTPNWHSAEDIASEVWERAVLYLKDRYVWRGRDLSGWLVTLAANRILAWRASSYSRRMIVNSDLPVFEYTPDRGYCEEETSSATAAIEVWKTVLGQAIDMLTPAQRTVIQRIFYEGWGWDEAGRYSCPSRAIMVLRRILTASPSAAIGTADVLDQGRVLAGVA